MATNQHGPVRSETSIEQRQRLDAVAAGWFVEKIIRTSRNGFPDRFYAKDGRVVLIEWKKPRGTLQKIQEVRIKELRDHGVEVHVVDNVDDANRVLGIGYVGKSSDLSQLDL